MFTKCPLPNSQLSNLLLWLHLYEVYICFILIETTDHHALIWLVSWCHQFIYYWIGFRDCINKRDCNEQVWEQTQWICKRVMQLVLLDRRVSTRRVYYCDSWKCPAHSLASSTENEGIVEWRLSSFSVNSCKWLQLKILKILNFILFSLFQMGSQK